jgi:hypothetical protein
MSSDRDTGTKASFSIPSILAVICGILAFTTSAGTATFAAVGAMIFGVIGALMALLPGKRGGIASIAFIFIGALGFVIGLLRLIL